MNEPAPKRSIALRLGVPLLPVTSLAILLASLLGLFGPVSLGRLWMQWGYASFLLFASTVLGVCACSVLLVFVARGKNVPTAALLLCASLPWGVTFFGLPLVASRTIGAIEGMDPSVQAPAMAMGLSETLSGHFLGTAATGALCLSIGLGIGLVAVAQNRSEERSRRVVTVRAM